MQDEAEIKVNGTRLTHDEARIVRLALESFADILENQLGFKDEGIQISDKYATRHGARDSANKRPNRTQAVTAILESTVTGRD
jgi:hypothetical protein